MDSDVFIITIGKSTDGQSHKCKCSEKDFFELIKNLLPSYLWQNDKRSQKEQSSTPLLEDLFSSPSVHKGMS